MKYLLIACLFLLPPSLKAQTPSKPGHPLVSKSLFTPDNFYVLNDSMVLISDSGIKFPVYLVNMKNDTIVAKIRVGNGPAELSQKYKKISITNNYIYIWDFGHQLLKYYDHKLNYVGSEAFNKLGFTYSVKVSPDNVFVIGPGKDFLTVYKYNKKNIIGKKEKVISISDDKYFKQFSNYTIRQYFVSTIRNNHLILANRYTSLVFSVDKSGLNFANLKPLNVDQSTDESRYVTTLTTNTLCSLDIEAKKQNIFVLSKGKKMNEEKLHKAFKSNTQLILLNRYEQSQNLLIYNKTGSYIKKVKLPLDVKRIDFYNDKIYYLRINKDGLPIMGVLKKQNY